MAYKEYPAKDRRMTQTFRGINRHEHIADGEWFDMLNLTCDEYPVAKTREHRAYVRGDSQPMTPGRPTDAVCIDDKIYISTDAGFVVQGNRRQQVRTAITQIAAFGKRIFAKEGYYFENDLETCTAVEVDARLTVSVSLCDSEGAAITYDESATAPANPQNGQYWYDTEKKGFYVYSEAMGTWVALTTGFIKLTVNQNLQTVGDEILANMMALYDENNPTATPEERMQFQTESEEMIALLPYADETKPLPQIKAGDAVRITDEDGVLNGAYVVYAVGDNMEYIVLSGLTLASGSVTVTIERRCPKFDYIIEHNNRMWGCRYGENDDGEFVNEIYASALGDPLNWFLYEGTAHDSWTVSIGEPGEWTGIGEADGYLFFFKQDCVIVVSGSAPSSFRTVTIPCNGCQRGSSKSIMTVNGTVYYKSNHGIHRISGTAYPQMISEELGYDKWTDAVAGTDGRKYYISMSDGNGRSMYVYDTFTGLWSREDDATEELCAFVQYRNNLLAIGGKETDTWISCSLKYDKAAAAAAKPNRADYPNVMTWLTVYFAWLFVMFQSMLYGIAYSLESIATLEDESTLPGVVAKLREMYNDGALFVEFKEHNCWNVEYVFISNDKPRTMDIPAALYAYDDFALNVTEITCETETEPDFAWFAETGNLGLDEPNEKRIRVLQIRAKSGPEASLYVQAMFDGANAGEMLRCENRGKTGTYRVASTPARRFDTYKLRLSGTGDTVIYSITTETEDAGDYVR